jgi:restriction system protein
MVDPRFVDTLDVMSDLDSRPNLMEFTPTEFEGLITNLFASMGLDPRQTRPSRDGGVDCVAFDSRPVFGRKVIVQAKRHKSTVGGSAVRDLFGTVQNEGASKGIFVTTSGYGSAVLRIRRGQATRSTQASTPGSSCRMGGRISRSTGSGTGRRLTRREAKVSFDSVIALGGLG